MQQESAIILDDHKIFAESLSELLKKIGLFGHIYTSFDVKAAKEELSKNEYTYLLTDLIIPGSDVKEFISFAKKQFPHLIVIVITALTDIIEIKELFTMGVRIFLSKTADSAELNRAINKASQGLNYLSPDIAGSLANAVLFEETNRLTKREMEILKYVAKGYTIVETAKMLHLSEHTIITHRKNIMGKIGVNSAIEMVKFAYDHKLL